MKKNTASPYSDAHLHLACLTDWDAIAGRDIASCAHNENEFIRQRERARQSTARVICGFGVHPQNPDASLLDAVEKSLALGEADSVGEAGFDSFSAEFASRMDEQVFVWDAQLTLAHRYHKPLVVHCRKELERIFASARKLAALPSVIFHSFPGSPKEALSLLARGINAYFSLGKPVLNGRKQSVRCACEIEEGRLLAETDAPYQRLKDESHTRVGDIERVYEGIARLRGMDTDELSRIIKANFSRAFWGG